ncbi:hypothetical protein GCM10023189_40480 [Nibrella saemangeumensis]|uniref:DUF3945 domain-containing protein n=1 Tax=Nibrella saemangeumensis TaxID=1084526 RepID=A0ABP8NB54_9BACT
MEANQTSQDRPARYPTSLLAELTSRFGIELDDANAKKLLNGQKTDLQMLPDGTIRKFYLTHSPDQGIHINQIEPRKELTLSSDYLGHAFTEEDKNRLQKYGEMGRRVDLNDAITNQPFKGYIGVDADTKTLTVLREDRFRFPEHIKGVQLNEQQKESLRDGKLTPIHGMTGADGQSFDALVQVSAAKRSLIFRRLPQPAQQEQQKADANPQVTPVAEVVTKPNKATSQKTGERKQPKNANEKPAEKTIKSKLPKAKNTTSPKKTPKLKV